MKKTVLLLFIASLFAGHAFSQVIVPFVKRFEVTQRGGLVMVANSILTCNGGAGCGSAQGEVPPAGNSADNDFNSGYIDIDGVAATFSSSSADLNLAACSKVTWAGLYWGAAINVGNSKYNQRNQIKIKQPGASSYTTLTADTFYDHDISYDAYNCFADITSLVAAAGNGTYTMADLVAVTGGNNQWGGWGIVVVFKNDLLVDKNITVYDGVSNIDNDASAVTVNVTGFYTPPSGAVNFELGEIAYDGDRSFTGDSLLFKGAATFRSVFDGIHPLDDVFNSTIANNGVQVLTRNPAHKNTLGFDANIFRPNNAAKTFLSNGATTASIKVTTDGEQIFLQTITSAIDTYEPHMQTTKTVSDVNGGTVSTGDTLLYTVTVNNTGNDTSVTTTLIDTLPFNADYVPGSIAIISGPNTGAKTDVAGDDQARFDTTAGFSLITVNMGTGATAGAGGNLPQTGVNSTTAFTFKVKITDDCTKLLCNPTISNRISVNYKGKIAGIQRKGFSNPILTDSLGCPIDGFTSTSVTVPVSCSPPPDSSIGGCLPLKFDSIPGIRPGYVYYNSAWTPVIRANTVGTYWGLRSIVGVSCKDTIRYTVYVATVTPSNAGSDQSLCNVTSTSLAGNTPAIGAGKWTLVSGPNVPTFTANTSPTTSVTGMITGTYQFRWTISLKCDSSADIVQVIIYAVSTTANAGADQTLCNVASATLAGNTPAAGSGVWTLVSGPNSPTITTPTSPTSTVTGMVAGVYTLRWTVTNGVCSSTNDDVQITIYASPTTSNAGADQNLCNVTTTSLAGNNPAIGSGTWTLISGPNTPTITTPSSPTSSITGMIAGVYIFRWSIGNGTCAPSTDNVQITIYATPTVSDAGPDQNLCNVNTATMAGNAAVAGSGTWTRISGPNTPTITTPTSPTTTLTGMIAGTYVYRWTISNGVCTASTDDVQIIIYALPTASNAGPDQNLCNVISTTLAGNNPAIGGGTWTVISGPNSPTITTPASNSSTVTGMIAGAYTLRWTITNGVCASSTDDVVITIYALPTVSNAGADQNICNVTSVTLSGNGPTVGSGTWTRISGPNVPTITTPGASNTNVSGMIAGVYVFRWTISNGVCASSTDDVQITIDALPTVSNAGADQNLCNVTGTTFAGNAAVVGTGSWSLISGPNSPTITAPSNPLSTITGMIAGVYVFRWTIINGICAASTDDVQITIYALPTVSNAGPDQNLCNTNTATFAGNNPAVGTGNWSMISGPNSPTITTSSSPTSTITGMIPGTYVFRWTISNGVCAVSTDDVQMIIYALPTVSNAGADQSLCNVTSTVISANAPAIGTGTWTLVSGPNVPTITAPASANTSVTGMIAGIYVFRWTIMNGVCATSTDDVQVTIYALPTVSNAGPDQNLCNTNSATFAGNNPAVGSGNWTLVSGPNVPTITTPSSPTSTITGLISGVYVFTWTISNGVCATSANNVQITIYDLPTVSSAGPDQSLCNVNNTTLAGNAPATGSGLWTLLSGPNTPTITTNTNPASTVTGMVAGVYTFRWTITNGICAASTDDVQITIYALPTVSNAGADQNLCNVVSTTFTGNNPVIGTGSWSLISGPNVPTITAPSSATSTVTGMIPGVYVFQWTITNGVCATSTDNVQITNYDLPTTSNAGPDQSLCNVNNTSFAGNTPAFGTGSWTLISGPNAPTITTPSSPTSTITGMITGTYTFRWTITNGVCATSSDDVQIIIYALPTVASAGADQNLCNVNSVTLAGNNGAIGNKSWSLISGPNVPAITTATLFNTTVTGMIPGVYVFRWTISNGVCAPSTDDVQITIYALPTVSNAGPDQDLCNVNSATLAANNPVNGTGNWTLISGPNVPAITTPSSNSSTVTGMIPGVYTLRWTISNGVCAISTDDVSITIYALPTVATAGVDQNLCNVTSVTLSGDVAVVGSGNWTMVSGPNVPTITTPSSPTSTVTGMIAGVYIFEWTITNGVCAPSTDDVQIEIFNLPTVVDAGPDQDLCNITTATMAGNVPGVGTGTWTLISGPNVPTIVDINDPATVINSMVTGTYIFGWAISNGVCFSYTDSVTVVIYDLPTVAVAGPNQDICSVTSTILNGNEPTVGTGQWTLIGGPNVPTITSPDSANTTVTGMITGAYTFRWTIISGPCAPSTSDVIVTIFNIPLFIDAGPDQNLCDSTQAVMAGNVPGVGIGTWTLISGPNSPSIIDPNDPATTITGMIAGNYLIGWTITNGVCVSPTDTIVVNIFASPTVAAAGLDQSLCNVDSTIMTGNTAVIGNGTWTMLSGPNAPLFADASNETTTITGMIPGTYIFTWTITNGVCTTTSDNMQVDIYALPTVADAGLDQSLCNIDSVVLTANTAITGNGNWSIVSGPNVPVITDATNEGTSVTGLIPGTYILAWTITSGVCAISSDTVQVTMDALPTVANAGIDQSLCNISVAALAGNAPATGTGLWSLLSGPNVPTIAVASIPSTSVSGLIEGVYQFAWSITNGVCATSIDTVEISLFDLPTISNAGPDQNLCAAASTSLAANTAFSGTGLWTLSSGPNTPTIVDPTDTATTITGLIPGTYVFNWTIDNGSCTVSMDSVEVVIYLFPPFVDAGPEQDLCNTTSISLSGNSPVSGAGTWTLISGPNSPTILFPNSPSTSVTGMVAGTYNFAWNIVNGTCSAYGDTMEVIINDLPTIADAGTDQSLCNVDSTRLAGNIPATGIGNWTVISGPNTPVFTDSTNALSDVTGMLPGVYQFVWTVSSGICSVSMDTVQVSIFLVPLISDAGLDQNLCNTDSAVMAATIPASGVGTWTLQSGPNSPVITSPNSETSSITGMIAGTYVFGWTINNGVCSTPTDDVTITIYDLPTISNSGTDQVLCNDTSVFLSGNSAISGIGIWSLVSGPNSPSIVSPSSSSTFVDGLISGNYIFEWTISNGICTSSIDSVSITVDDLPSTSLAGPDQSICNVTSITLAGNAPATGTGNWTLVSGPNIPVITNPALENTSVTGMIAGTYRFVWSISIGVCSASTDTVDIDIFDLPSTADAGVDQDLCNGGTATMGAVAPLTGSGTWTFISGPSVPVITNPTNPAAALSALVKGTYIFCWTVNNGSCSISTDTVLITMEDILSPAVAGSDQDICNNSTIPTATILSGNSPASGTGTWTRISGPNIPTIFAPNSPTTIVSNLIDGVYVFRWTITNGVCVPFSDDVTVSVYSVEAFSNAGNDQALCNVTSTNLAADAAVSGVGNWTLISGPNVPAINSLANPNTTVNGLIPGVYEFGWTLTNNMCSSSTDIVEVTVYSLPTISDAGLDQEYCNDSVATLNGIVPVTGTGSWSFISGASSATIDNPSLPNTTISGLLPGDYNLRWTISNGVCSSSSDDVQVTIYDLPGVAAAGPDTITCGSTTVLLTGNPPVNGTGLWSSVSGPNIPTISCPDCPSVLAENLTTGVYIFQWTLSNGTCATVNDDVQITIIDNPGVASAGIDQSVCGGDTAFLFASVPSFGTGTWTLISGPNIPTILQPDSAQTPVVDLGVGTYTFRWTITNGICSQFDDVDVLAGPSPVITTNGTLFNICPGQQVGLIANGALSYNWTPANHLSSDTIYNPIASPNHTTTYVVTGTDLNGCRGRDSLVVEVCDTLIIPSGFSPDGDGVNDNFTIVGIDNYPGNTLYIYNRWGNLIFRKDNYDNSFDGIPNVGGLKLGSGKVPSGAYFYVVELGSDEEGKSGYVIIKY